MLQRTPSVIAAAGVVAAEAPAVVMVRAAAPEASTAGCNEITASVTESSGRDVGAPVPLLMCLAAALAVCVASVVISPAVAARSAGGVPHVIGVHVAVPAITAVACGRFLSPIVLALSVVGIVPSVLI